MSAAALAELLEELAAAPLGLRRACAAVGADELRRRPAPDQFSPLENAWHLRDIEVEGYAPRIAKILTADRPDLASLDGDRMAVERRYNELELAAALDGFSQARLANVCRLCAAGPAEFARRATLEGRSLDLAGLVAAMVEHDRGHLSAVRGAHAPSLAA